MPMFENKDYFQHLNNPAFNVLHKPGQTPPYSGIYRCAGCGKEVVGEQARFLPPQNHHQHAASQGPVAWRLVAAAIH